MLCSLKVNHSQVPVLLRVAMMKKPRSNSNSTLKKSHCLPFEPNKKAAVLKVTIRYALFLKSQS